MADPNNPFAGFFSGLRSGLEAGESAERRGDSFFKTMVRAAANSDLTQQDRRMQQELEFRMSDQALRTNIAAQRQELARQQHLQEVAEENARLENEIQDAAALNELTSRMANVSTLEEWEAFPQNQSDIIRTLSPTGGESWRKMFEEFGESAKAERLVKMRDLGQQLGSMGYTAEEIPKTYGERVRLYNNSLMEQPIPKGVSSITRQLHGGGQVTVRAEGAGVGSEGATLRDRMAAFDDYKRALRDFDELKIENKEQGHLDAADERIRTALRVFASLGGDIGWLAPEQQSQYASIFSPQSREEGPGARGRITTDDPIPEGLINKDNAPAIINILDGTYR